MLCLFDNLIVSIIHQLITTCIRLWACLESIKFCSKLFSKGDNAACRFDNKNHGSI